jgi:hypothetical protein
VLMVRFMPDGLIGLLKRKASRPAEAPRA